MPTDYHCEDCNLALQIGWYHYHNTKDGFWAATLGFCQNCGTIHKMEHFGKSTDQQTPDRMFAQPGPLQIAESKIKGVQYRVPLETWIALEQTRTCGYCRAVDQVLFKEGATVAACPRCGSQRMRKLYTWMT